MWMVIILHTLTALGLNIFQKKLIYSHQGCRNKYLYNTTKWFNNVGYICIGFIDFMLKHKILLGYVHLFSPNEHEKNDKTILKYFE